MAKIKPIKKTGELKRLRVKALKKAKSSDSYVDEIKRLNRISGQVEAIRSMLIEGRALPDVLMQCKAIHSALHAVEQQVFAIHVEASVADILDADKRKQREAKLAELKALFKAK